MSTLYERTKENRKSAKIGAQSKLTIYDKAQICVNFYVFGVSHEINAAEFGKCEARMSEVCRLKDYLHKQNSPEAQEFLKLCASEAKSVGYRFDGVDWENRILKFSPLKSTSTKSTTNTSTKSTKSTSTAATKSTKKTAAQVRLEAKKTAAQSTSTAAPAPVTSTSDTK